jgi:hypothetical protein
MKTKSTKKDASKKAAKTPAEKPAPATATPPKAPRAKPEPRPRDPRLPKPGGILTRKFQNKEIKVEVLDAGFRFDGKVWRSLSSIAKAVSGTSWNGFLFFGIQKRSKAAVAPKDGAK